VKALQIVRGVASSLVISFDALPNGHGAVQGRSWLYPLDYLSETVLPQITKPFATFWCFTRHNVSSIATYGESIK